MTEEEARTKWCPHVRKPFGSGGAGNRPTTASTECIGSACSAWLWAEERVTKKSPTPLVDHDREQHGYCGLLAVRP